jgi:hypothetical protein
MSWIRNTVSRTVLFSQRPKTSLPSDEGESFLRTPGQNSTQKSTGGMTRTGLLDTPSQKSTHKSNSGKTRTGLLDTPSQKSPQKSNSGKTRTGLLDTPSQKSTNMPVASNTPSQKSTKASSSEEETESQLLSSLPLSVLDIKVSV